MIFPRSITDLAEKNRALLETLNFDPSQDDPCQLDTAAVYRDSGLFPDAAVEALFDESAAFASYEIPADVRLSKQIGMVLVRPDMYHIRNRIEQFVADRFRLLESETVEVTPLMYWDLYSEAILDRELPQARLSRAAVYIGSPCQLLLFESERTYDGGNVPVADYMYDHLKGEKGVPEPGTLRGEVVYDSALHLGLHTLREVTIGQAVDPFGAYRKIVDRGSGRHSVLEHPLLFYTGVGVHVPNYAELQTDAVVMTNAIEKAVHE